MHFPGQGGNENILTNTEAIILVFECHSTDFFTWVKPLDGNFSEKDMRQRVLFCAIVTSDIVNLFLVEFHHIFSGIC